MKKNQKPLQRDGNQMSRKWLVCWGLWITWQTEVVCSPTTLKHDTLQFDLGHEYPDYEHREVLYPLETTSCFFFVQSFSLKWLQTFLRSRKVRVISWTTATETKLKVFENNWRCLRKRLCRIALITRTFLERKTVNHQKSFIPDDTDGKTLNVKLFLIY